MNLIVLMKEVPDMDRVRFDSERGVVDRTSAQTQINPFDLHALQAAVNLRDQLGGTVTVITMGPPQAERSLRDAFARGADQVVLLTDKKFGGSDTLATSRTLAAAIQKLGTYDLIFSGEKSIDGDTAQVGPEVAELLGIPHVCYAEKISPAVSDESDASTPKQLKVVTEAIGGWRQHCVLQLPALISVTKNIVHPELPLLKRKLESLKVEVCRLGFDDLKAHLTEEQTGFKGSPTKVVHIDVPKEVHRQSRLYKEDEAGFLKDALALMTSSNLL